MTSMPPKSSFMKQSGAPLGYTGEVFSINPFLVNGQGSHFIPPEKTRKSKVFWSFQGVRKWEPWPEMG